MRRRRRSPHRTDRATGHTVSAVVGAISHCRCRGRVARIKQRKQQRGFETLLRCLLIKPMSAIPPKQTLTNIYLNSRSEQSVSVSNRKQGFSIVVTDVAITLIRLRSLAAHSVKQWTQDRYDYDTSLVRVRSLYENLTTL